MRSLLGRFHRPMSRGAMGDMLTMNSLGDGSTLSLDFTTMGGVLDPRLTFTRASTVATYINSSGYVATATTNVPRFDYSPTNIGEPRGLLVEGQTANVCPRSQELTTGWQNVSMNTPTVPSSPTITDPFGGTSATWKLVASSSATSVTHTWRHATLTFTAASYTFSFWAKAAEYDRIMLCDPGRGRGGCLFVLTGNGTATVVANIVTPTNPQITPYPNGWYRCSVTMVLSAENYAFGISGYPSSGATTGAFGPNYISNGTSGVYATAMQIELGSGASSYIPTGASGVTRNADMCYLTDFAGWSAGGNFNTAEGTLFVDQAVTYIGTTNYPAGGFSTSNTVGSRFGWQYRQGESPQTYRGLVNAGYLYELPGGAGWSIPSGTTRFRHAMSCGGGTSAFLRQSFKSSASSSSPTQNNYSDTSTLNISGVAAFTLTQSAFASSVRIAKVKYWPRAFTLNELDSLTT